MKKFLLFTVLALISVVAFAQTVTLPTDVDAPFNYLGLIQELIANPKAFLSVSGVALLVFLSTQALKKFGFKAIPDKLQFLLISFLGLVYSFLVKKIGGDPSSTILVGLAGSMTAASFFSALKLNFPKFFNLIEGKK